MKITAKILAGALFLVTSVASANQRFTNPYYEGYRLDYCFTYGSDCGSPAALAFCQWKGFSGVADYRVANNVGLTKVIGTGQLCEAPTCGSFQYIECH